MLKVIEDDKEIGSYMFRRTVPSIHLTPDDVRWMVCAFYLFSHYISKLSWSLTQTIFHGLFAASQFSLGSSGLEFFKF